MKKRAEQITKELDEANEEMIKKKRA